ncbi:Translin-associated factor X-interacting protein 1 [Collichthys lucidus]|uniref:Translin-associated factor X-interacting protein 1 n=1 Tax=Collichthys lucidus TaxID=240159 RepID=A0A4U5UG38_COLLU|nr:Translin-associated factor X-interacting protein 1 [Collichthys lucidus]
MLKSHLDPRTHKVLRELSAEMSTHKDVRFPPLTPSQEQRQVIKMSGMRYSVSLKLEQQHDTEEEDHEGRSVSVRPAAGKVYRHTFDCFIKEFKTYRPLLSAIKQEYEKTLAHQQDQIKELEPLRSCLRRVTEDCDRKIRARWAEEQAEIGELKREKRRLQKDVKDMREREEARQASMDRLQSELSDQYLQYREERDARRLLVWQLNEEEEEQSADGGTGRAAAVGGRFKQLIGREVENVLQVCRADLTKAQEELTRMKAEYWDVVPRRNWDALEQTHKQNLLQRDFDQMSSKYDTLLELHKEASMQKEAHEPITAQTDESASEEQIQVQCDQLTAPVNQLTAPVDAIPSQRLRDLLRTSTGAALI